MERSSRAAFFNIQLFLQDILVILVSYCCSWVLIYLNNDRFNMHDYVLDINNYVWIIIIFSPLWTLLMSTFNMYNNTMFNYYDRILRNITMCTIITGIFIIVLMNYIKEPLYNIKLFIAFAIFNFLLSLAHRYLYIYLVKNTNRNWVKQVIIVGVPELYEKFQYYINKTNIRIKVLGYVNLGKTRYLREDGVLGSIDKLEKILTENVIDEVIFAIPNGDVGQVESYVSICEEKGITASVILNLFNLKKSKVHLSNIGTLPMLIYHTVNMDTCQLFAKRLIDIIGALFGLVLTGVIGVFVMIAIKFDSAGPVIFAQKRVGVNGRIFKCYKFRSMHIDAEAAKENLISENQITDGLMFKVKDDPRVTRVGAFIRKTSIDELPQFLNVLLGDMSLVGTRPPTLDEVSRYDNRHWRRISVKPGITGLWQISGRSEICDFEEVVSLDVEYIDNWSIWLDLKIIFKTVKVVFGREGAY